MNDRVLLALVVGSINAALVYGNGFVLLDVSVPATGFRAVLYRAYYLIGTGLVGAGATYLLLRYGLVVPTVLAVSLTAFSLWDHVSDAMESFTPLYLGVWPFFAAALAVVAVAEFGVRWWLTGSPPGPVG